MTEVENCPKCNSKDIQKYDTEEYEFEAIYTFYECKDCGYEFVHYYEYIGLLESVDDE